MGGASKKIVSWAEPTNKIGGAVRWEYNLPLSDGPLGF